MEKMFAELWEKGESVKQIAKELKISEACVWEYVFKVENRATNKSTIEDEIVDMWNSDFSISEIADELNVAEGKVRSYVRNHRVSCPRRNGLNPSKVEHTKFVKLWNDGTPIKEMSDKLGICLSYVGRYAADHRDECPKRSEKDESNIIEALWKNSVPINEIAQILGVSEEYVWSYAFCHESVDNQGEM